MKAPLHAADTVVYVIGFCLVACPLASYVRRRLNSTLMNAAGLIETCLSCCRPPRDRGPSRDSPEPSYGPGGGHSSRSPSPYTGGPGTSRAVWNRQQMAEGLDGLQPAGPAEAAAAASSRPSTSHTKPAARETGHVSERPSVSASAEGDVVMGEIKYEEGQVKEAGESNGARAASNGQQRGGTTVGPGGGASLGSKQAKQQRQPIAVRRSASPEPSAWSGGNGRAEGSSGNPSLPFVIAGVSRRR